MKQNQIILILSGLGLLLATSCWAVWESGTLNAPPSIQKDDVFYDNLAFNLAGGNGFSYDFTDPEWRQVYLDTNSNGSNDWIFEIDIQGPTATRAPVWPLVVSVVYRAVGRRFDAVRILNIALLSISLTILMITVQRFYGAWTAALATTTLAFDFAVLRTAGHLMTEALATAWVALLFSATVILIYSSNSNRINQRPNWIWLPIGLGMGILTLIRPNTNVWLMLMGLVWFSMLFIRTWQSKAWKPLFIRGSLFVLGVALIAAPWWIRNCQTVGHFEPWGTSGSIGAAGDYSDGALANGGNWDLPTVLKVQKEAAEKYDFSKHNLAEREYLIGLESKRAAWDWIRSHPDQLPRLMAGKAFQHLGLSSTFHPVITILNCFLLAGAIVGIYVSRHDLGRLMLALFLLSLLTTMLTVSHFGRYSIPIRPLLHVSSAIGTVWIGSYLFKKTRN